MRALANAVPPPLSAAHLQRWVSIVESASVAVKGRSAVGSVFIGATRALAIVLGSFLIVAVPTELLAAFRRAANAASGHIPNMEPGVVVTLAVVLAAPITAGVLLIEFTRSWGWGQKPLSIPAAMALGALAVWPVSYSFLSGSVHFGYPALLLISTLGVAAFYAARWVWLARSNRNRTETRA